MPQHVEIEYEKLPENLEYEEEEAGIYITRLRDRENVTEQKSFQFPVCSSLTGKDQGKQDGLGGMVPQLHTTVFVVSF